MARIIKFWKVIVLDTLGILLMIGALLTGWLPGPTGIPMFIAGLSLLAIHHEWARRYVNLAKKYANQLGDLVFVKNPQVQLLYDFVAPLISVGGVLLLLRRSAIWMITLGLFLFLIGIVIFLGNRQRWQRLRRRS